MQPQEPITPNPQPTTPPDFNNQPPVTPTVGLNAQHTPMPQQQVGATINPTMESQPPQQYTPPAPQSHYQQMPSQPLVSTEDPGKTLSILGICLFIIPIIGISLSIIGMMKSKGSGYSGKLGKIGVGVNIASIVLSLLFFVIFPILFTKNAVDQLNKSAATNSTSQTTQNTESNSSENKSSAGLAVGMSKADVAKELGMEPVGCVPGVGGKTETCTYRNGSGASNSSTLVNATFTDGKLTKASGYTDNGNNMIKVG